MTTTAYKTTKWFYVLVVSFAAGAVTNLILFFGLAIIFSGDNTDSWVAWYLGSHDGAYFMLGTVLIALPMIPLAKKLNIVEK